MIEFPRPEVKPRRVWPRRTQERFCVECRKWELEGYGLWFNRDWYCWPCSIPKLKVRG